MFTSYPRTSWCQDKVSFQSLQPNTDGISHVLLGYFYFLLHEYLILCFPKKINLPTFVRKDVCCVTIHLIFVLCFNDSGENGACFWTIMECKLSRDMVWLSKDNAWRRGGAKQEATVISERISKLRNAHGNNRWPVIASPQWTLRPLSSTVFSNFFYKMKVLGLRLIWVPQLPQEAIDCYSYRLHWWMSQSSIIFYQSRCNSLYRSYY